MDGGVVSLEGFGADPSQVSDSKSRGFGSGFLKQERSDLGEEQWRTSKVLKAEGDFSVSKSTPLHHGTPLARSERILSFSSLKPEVTFLSKDGAGYGLLSGSRGPFTPSQWIELEHQALIYKYLLANVPVPSNLLIPLKRSFNPYGLSGSSAGSLHPNSLGWGSFHLGFSGNTDPEIGRCRRTDGKKWRCSRDAVADQKYCEKHMNRGRHRSRKPVEGQNGHAAPSSGPTNAKMVSIASSPSASVISNGGGSNVLSLGHTQFKNLLPGATNPSADALVNRLQDPRGLSMTSSTTTVTLPNQEIPFEDSTQMEFGLVPSNSLLNPSQAGSYMSSKSYSSFLSFADTETHNDQHPVHQFVDNWPKDQLNHSIISWPEDLKSDWTQLSMSIPMASDISSSASSPADDLLGPIRKHAWGASLGGPLGEVLTNTSMGSSPTGVLQKSSFGSQSNSSSGSSPIAQSRKTHESLSLYDDTLCPSAANSVSIPTL